MTCRRTALAAALSLLPLGQPLLLGTLAGITTATTAVILQTSAAVAQDASAVARVAKQVTVLVAGASSPGSGVIVKKEGNRYTVLTAWHVIKDTTASEVIEIKTPDGEWHETERGSIKRLGKVDMAVLTFSSSGSYEVASVGDIKSVSSGNPIFVSGFPLPSSSVPTSIWRFLKGDVIANATVAIPDGYQLLYSNPTLPGMSGGSVLNGQGQLVGIHGRSEKDDQVSMSTGKAVSTGTNQSVPISYYRQFDAGEAVVASRTQATSADDYLAQAKVILGKKGREQEVIRLANQALALQPSSKGYFYRAYAKDDLKDYQGAIADYNKAIEINPQLADAYNNRGNAKDELKDYQGALADYNKAIEINPQDADTYYNRGNAKKNLKDYQGAIADYTKAIEINPQHPFAYTNRGSVKDDLGDYQGAIADYNKAIEINPQLAEVYYNRGSVKNDLGDYQGAIADYNKAIEINPQLAAAYNNRGFTKGVGFNNSKGACEDFKKAASLGDEYRTNWLNSEDGAWCRNMR